MFKLNSEKAEEPEIKLPTSIGSQKARDFQQNIYFCFTDYDKAFDSVDNNKLWKIFKEMGIPDHLSCLLSMQVKKQQLDMEKQTGSKLGKEYVYCHSTYLTYMRVHHEKCWNQGCGEKYQ